MAWMILKHTGIQVPGQADCAPVQLELRPVMNDANVDFNPFIFLTNAGAAFALNMSVFMLIGRTSALTMNVAGVIKVIFLQLL